jgi:hypothetical protein
VSNALGEQWSFAAVVITAIILPGCRCLFEGHPVLLHERLRVVGHDAVRVFTMHVIDPLDAQLPDHPYPCSATRREGVGSGHHAAQLWRSRFCHVMLDHAGAIVGGACPAADVLGRTTALIFSLRKVEQPFSNVDFSIGTAMTWLKAEEDRVLSLRITSLTANSFVISRPA